MKAETLPPQANFAEPAGGLRYAGGPFRVLANAEPWHRRADEAPRRAAVSGFGFGGVNAHLLLEEWTDRSPKQAQGLQSLGLVSPAPVAIVGMAAHFGPWDDLRKFQEHVLRSETFQPVPKVNGWGLAAEPCPPAFGIEQLKLPIDRFRIPPKELEETLPQQLLMLQVAAAALDDCRSKPPESGSATGVFVGLGLDPNTMNFHLRWSVLARGGGDPDAASPPLTANRTMGALGSIAASRIARTFGFGGPSHTVCSEEASAARALELGVRALQAGELDRALVGGVDLACDPRAVLPGEGRLPGEGAAAFVLKRLADAERDGDRVYAVIRGVGVAAEAETALSRATADAGTEFEGAVPFDATVDVGNTGAASAAASLAKACLSLWQEVLPGRVSPSPARGEGVAPLSPCGRGVGGEGMTLASVPSPGGEAPPPSPAGGEGHQPPRYWLHDREAGPRRAAVTAAGADGSHFAILLEEHAENAEPHAHVRNASNRSGAGRGRFRRRGQTPRPGCSPAWRY